jgi:Protein of unknown function (DUF2867)
MRLPNSVHTSRPWRIHELTRDFRLEDVWELPGVGGPDAFPLLVQLIASGDPSQSSSVAVRTLFAIRWKIGELLGWDGPDAGLGSRVPTLRDRLPADLRDAPSGPDFDALPFTSLYLLEDEWAAEIANRTMHGVMHIGRVQDETGGFRAHMAVYVKPNGLLGSAYTAAIRPFRHLIVYPPMLREMGRNWQTAGAVNRSDRAKKPDGGSDSAPRSMGLHLSEGLERVLSSTNLIENLFSRVREIARRVKRWQGGTMILRWTAAGVLEAQRHFRKVAAYRALPRLAAVLHARDVALDRARGVDNRGTQPK